MKTDKKGEFMQIGLSSGRYKVTADEGQADGLANRAGSRRAGRRTPSWCSARRRRRRPAAEAAAVAALRKTARRSASPPATPASTTRRSRRSHKAIEAQPDLLRLLLQHRLHYAQKKDYDKAETNYKKAIEMKADYADAYTGLASIYNAQRKFDEAAAASAKATELVVRARRRRRRGGGADALFNQGVILWNGGKVAEAKKAFEAAIQANPEPRRSALSARHGARERRQPRRRGDRVRNVPEARAGRTERRDRQGTRRATEEVVLDSAALRARLADVRDRIARAAGRAGRDPASIRLVAVSKTFDAEYVRAAADAGQVDFGENKVQEALQKMDRTAGSAASLASGRPPAVEQGRKAAARFDTIHSVDDRRACW